MNANAARPMLLLLLLVSAAVVYFAGNIATPLWDRDEPRYAQCSRQMLESGDWVVPRLYDEPRAAKPPLIYWCQASAMKLIGDTPVSRWMTEPQVFAARLPSSLAMLLTLGILYLSLRGTLGESRTLWTLFVFSSALLTIFCAKICLTDSVQLVFITTAQLALFRLWRGNRDWVTVILLGVVLGLGGLTKGPFILGIVATTAVALIVMRYFLGATAATSPLPFISARTHFRRLIPRGLLIVLIFLAIVLPWLYLVHQREPGFLTRSTAELKKHVGQGGEGHSFWPGYHLLLIWVTFLPWSLLLPMAIALGFKNHRDPVRRFALAAVIGPWLMLEFMGTKLPHYAIAFFPALSFLTADAIVAALHPRDLDDYVRANVRSPGFIGAAGIWATIVALMAAGSIGLLFWLRRHHVPQIPWMLGWMFALVVMIYAKSVLLCFWARRPRAGLIVMGVGSGVIAFLLFGFYLPRAPFLQLSPRIAGTLRSLGVTHPGEVYMVDYKEPSLAFYQGGSIRQAPEHYKSLLVTKGHVDLWTPWLVITDQVLNHSPAEVQKRLTIVDRRRGLSISDGMRILDVIVVKTDRNGFDKKSVRPLDEPGVDEPNGIDDSNPQ